MLTDLYRQTLAGARLLLALTLVLGVGYPLAVGAGARALGDRADGQLEVADGRVVGSALVGQRFEGDAWFHSRPSVNDYDGLASAASNLGPSNPQLISTIHERRQQVATREGVAAGLVPADAVTASASGLDPHISPAYARLQAPRVARVNGMDVATVRRLVEEHTVAPFLGVHGAEAVDVLELNVAIREAGDGAD